MTKTKERMRERCDAVLKDVDELDRDVVHAMCMVGSINDMQSFDAKLNTLVMAFGNLLRAAGKMRPETSLTWSGLAEAHDQAYQDEAAKVNAESTAQSRAGAAVH